MFVKRLLAVWAAVVIMILPVCAACESPEENLLKNPDFMHIGNNGLPENWYTDAYIQEAGYTLFGISEGDPEHPVAVSIRNIGENDARFAQKVKVEPETLYCLSGYIRATDVNGGHGANLSVEGVYAFSDKCFDTEGDWEYIEYYGETGPDQDYITVFVRLGGYSGVSTGEACFADISLVKADSVPGDGIADLWYKPDYTEADYDYEDEDEEAEPEINYRAYMILTGVVYALAAAYILYLEHKRNRKNPALGKIQTVYVFIAFCISIILRLVISWYVKGYMVDVNCFLSWGHTMASVGPAGFYEATNFCDYPPLYTYVLAFNSWLSELLKKAVQSNPQLMQQLGGTEGITRIVFRFVPTLCDLAGCWMLYRLLIRQKELNSRSCFTFLILMLFNPAIILNSAAWGQMDSVLCLILAGVALYAVRGQWIAALPLYVVAVLIKPQALMLGPLGLAYIVIVWIRNPASRKRMIAGTGISLLTLAAGVIPFSIHQNPDWLIQLYWRTLSSYPYATVNTANFYYILGGNWSAVNGSAHILASILLALLISGYGVWWFFRAEGQRLRLIETIISGVFSTVFILFACLGVSWAWVGGTAMAFAFVIVLSPAVRSGDIRMLPWLGGLLYILLYVFGVKMHERYIFPALLLIAAAWVLRKDRRILYVLILFSFTVYLNEGIILDNSIRLGSEMGHLNRDTVGFADFVSIVNVLGAVYAVWLSIELFLEQKSKCAEISGQAAGLRSFQGDRKLHWNTRDTLLLSLITVIYSTVSLLTLGSTKAPQTCWTSSSEREQIVFDLGSYREDVEILYFAQISRNDFTFSASEDGEIWQNEVWAQMDQGQCWKWKYVTESISNSDGTRTYYNSDEENIVRFSGRYIRLTSRQLGLKLNEILFRDRTGTVFPVTISGQINGEAQSELYSDPQALIDEQDTIENLPAFPPDTADEDTKIQPSWWNSTYFDEIYHARTGFEFLKGYAPYETSHPPLGKVLISAGIAVFGMTPFGWRFAGALAGILMLPGMYLLGKQLTKKTWIAVMSCLMMALDCMHLTQTQIATIDSFPVLFIIFAYLFMLRFIQTDFVREKLHASLVPLALSGIFMGLSIASKWIGIYAGAGLAVLFFWHCARIIIMKYRAKNLPQKERETENMCETKEGISEKKEYSMAWIRTAVICACCVLFFILIPVLIYLASYIPYMSYTYYAQRIYSLQDYIREVWQTQTFMFDYHNTPNLGKNHPFYSPWWEWPIIGKPMYYASKQYLPSDSGRSFSIFAFGNPVIWFGGLAALLFCIARLLPRHRYKEGNSLYRWHIRSGSCDSRYMFLIVGLLAQYLPWVLVPRGTYIYHYFASIPFLMTAIFLCFDFRGKTAERICKISACVFIGLSALFFILLFPYASGLSIPVGWLKIGRSILRIWY